MTMSVNTTNILQVLSLFTWIITAFILPLPFAITNEWKQGRSWLFGGLVQELTWGPIFVQSLFFLSSTSWKAVWLSLPHPPSLHLKKRKFRKLQIKPILTKQRSSPKIHPKEIFKKWEKNSKANPIFQKPKSNTQTQAHKIKASKNKPHSSKTKAPSRSKRTNKIKQNKSTHYSNKVSEL